MQVSPFQAAKLRRLLNTQGQSVTFIRSDKNKFGEPIGEVEVFCVKGIFHETTSYLSKTSSDGSTVRAKSAPMLLCLWSDAVKLQHTDRVWINNHLYTVGEIKNVGEANVVADISLEEIQNNGNGI